MYDDIWIEAEMLPLVSCERK